MPGNDERPPKGPSRPTPPVGADSSTGVSQGWPTEPVRLAHCITRAMGDDVIRWQLVERLELVYNGISSGRPLHMLAADLRSTVELCELDPTQALRDWLADIEARARHRQKAA